MKDEFDDEADKSEDEKTMYVLRIIYQCIKACLCINID